MLQPAAVWFLKFGDDGISFGKSRWESGESLGEVEVSRDDCWFLIGHVVFFEGSVDIWMNCGFFD